MFLTALSARPLDWGLQGEDISCLMPLFEQKSEKSVRNWGPLSERMTAGTPRSRNQVSSWLRTEVVEREGSLAAKGNPVDLSTITSQFWLLTWKISIPTDERGGSILSGSTMVWVLGFDER